MVSGGGLTASNEVYAVRVLFFKILTFLFLVSVRYGLLRLDINTHYCVTVVIFSHAAMICSACLP